MQNIISSILGGMWFLIVWTWWIIVPIIIYYSWKNFKKAEYVEKIEHEILCIKTPKNNEKGPVGAEMMFASLHGILQPENVRQKGLVIQEHISFEIVSTKNSIEFFVWTPKQLSNFVEGQIYAQYPTAEITRVSDYSLSTDIDNDNVGDAIAGTELTLLKNEIYPIKTFQNFEVDPLAGITGMLSNLEGISEKVWIQILAKPVSDDWRDKGLGHISEKKSGKKTITTKDLVREALLLPLKLIPEMIALAVNPPEPPKDKKKAEKKPENPKLSHAEETELSAIEEKANKLGYRVIIRIIYLAKSNEKAIERIQSIVGAFKQFNTTNLNGFTSTNTYSGLDFLNAYRARLFNDNGYILNIEELASLYHLPNVSVETPNIVWTSSKKGEPPANVSFIDDISAIDPDLTLLAQTTYRGHNKPFGITRDDRRRHLYIIGKSGTGKSRLIENLAVSDILKGEGVAIVDPHGELIDGILKHIPKNRIDDVVYFNPADREYPIAFNPLECTPDTREEVANGFVSVVKKMFGYSWGPRLEYVLKHTVLALVEAEDTTMLGIVRMLTDKNYRKKIVSQVSNPVVEMFWLKEFASYNDKMATETIAPILNKVGQFTSSAIIRNIVGQTKSNIDFARIMNEQKILLVDLSTGKIGEANSALLGSMIITKIQQAAMSRAYIPEEERKDFYLYVDEFQNFATDSFATILSEARKYRLSLTVANQYIAQMEETVRDAVFGNIGSLISFRLGATDAAFVEKEFAGVFEQNDITNLDFRHIYLYMLINGVTSIPFSAMTMNSTLITNNISTIVKAVSRERYGTPLPQVEEAIRRWYGVDNVIAGIEANGNDREEMSENTNVNSGSTSNDKTNLEDEYSIYLKGLESDLKGNVPDSRITSKTANEKELTTKTPTKDKPVLPLSDKNDKASTPSTATIPQAANTNIEEGTYLLKEEDLSTENKPGATRKGYNLHNNHFKQNPDQTKPNKVDKSELKKLIRELTTPAPIKPLKRPVIDQESHANSNYTPINIPDRENALNKANYSNPLTKNYSKEENELKSGDTIKF